MTYLILFIFGLALGSFVNALVWRTHQSRSQQKNKLSVWRGRSMCTHCKTTLRWQDLVPVYSWLTLKGRCRYCDKKIDDTPLTELLVPVLFLVSYVFWPMQLVSALSITAFAVWLIIVVIFAAMFIYDLRWMILPDKFTLFFSVIAIVYIGTLTIDQSDVMVPLNAALGAATIAGLFYILHRASGGRWIGGGDVKLGFGLGLLAGSPVLAFMLIFIASIIGSIIALPSVFFKRLNLTDKVPFGPLLIISTIIVVLFGGSILQWYINTVLFGNTT